MKYLFSILILLVSLEIKAQFRLVVFCNQPRVPIENVLVYNLDSTIIGYTDANGELLVLDNGYDSLSVFIKKIGYQEQLFTLYKGTNFVFLDQKNVLLGEVNLIVKRKDVFFNKRTYGNKKLINQGGFFLGKGSMIALNIPQQIKRKHKVTSISVFVIDTFNPSSKFYVGIYESKKNTREPLKIIHDTLITVQEDTLFKGNKMRKIDVRTNNIFLLKNKTYSIVISLPSDQFPIAIGGNSSLADDYTWIYNLSSDRWEKNGKCAICINHFNAAIQLKSIVIK
jgi:hypothetical protein